MSYVADESPNVATQAQAPIGRCLDLDGIDDHIPLPALGLLTRFTLSIWVKTTAANASLMGNLDNTAGGVQLYLAGGQLRLYVSPAGLHFAHTTAVINDGNWHLVTGTWNGTTAKIYVDGSDVTSGQGAGCADPVSVVGGWKIGAYAATPVAFLDGQVFDARIYDRALTAAEVAAMFNDCRPGGNPAASLYAADLVGHWKLDEPRPVTVGDSTLFWDSSGNGKHAKATGTVTASYIATDDVPFSWSAESGYSDITDLDLVESKFGTDVDNVASRTFVGEGTTPPTVSQETFAGVANAWKMRVPAGADLAYAGCRIRTNGDAPVNSTHDYLVAFRIAISRPLQANENITCYYVGGMGIGSTTITSDDNVPVGEWFTVFQTVTTGTGSHNVRAVVFINGSGDAFDRSMDIWVADAKLIEMDTGTLPVGSNISSVVPQDDSQLTKDILGGDLQYVGPLARQATPFDSHALLLTSGGYVNCGDVADVDWTAKQTFRFTMRRTRTAVAEVALLKRTGNSTNDGASVGAGFLVYFSGTDVIKVTVDDGTNYQTFLTVDTYQDTAWHEYELEFNVGKTIKLWRDGILLLSVVTTVNSLANAAELRVGNSSVSPIVEVSQFSADGIVDLSFSEGTGTTIYNRVNGGSHATVVGGSATPWTVVQPLKHHNLMGGFRVTDATGNARSLAGLTSTYWTHAHDAIFAGEGNTKSIWWAGVITPDLAANRAIATKYAASAPFGWSLVALTDGRLEVTTSHDGTALQFALRAGFTSNVQSFFLVVYDHVQGKLFVMIDDDLIDAGAACSGVFADAFAFKLGQRGTSALPYSGTVGMFAMGKLSTPIDWQAMKNTMYNSGNPLAYADLTTEQKTQWGLSVWYDCDEYHPDIFDKHTNAKHLTGVGIPRIPAKLDGSAGADGGLVTNPAGAWHNGAETKVNFQPVASPWRSKMFVGYATCTGVINGPSVAKAVVGKVTNKMSIYCKFRYPELTGSNRTLFEADNGGLSYRMAVILTTAKQVTLFDGLFRVFAAVPLAKLQDSEWHEMLFAIDGTTARLWFDSVDMGTVVVNDLATAAAQWSRVVILSNANGSSNRYSGDVARIKVTATSEIPGTLHAATPLFDVRFNHGRVADINGGVNVVLPTTGLAFPKIVPPSAYTYRSALPYGMTKTQAGIKESRFSLYNIDV